YRYGFLVTAPQITTLKRGRETGFTSNDLAPVMTGGAANGPSIVSPAESVQSYGFASDGLSGVSTFTTNGGSPFSGAGGAINTETAAGVNGFQAVEQPHAFIPVVLNQS